MARTLREIQDLRSKEQYRETIVAVEEWIEENPHSANVRAAFVLEKAWAHYQLGEYGVAEQWGLSILDAVAVRSEEGESVGRLLAHCAERQGRLQEAEERLSQIPSSRARDNLRVTIMTAKKQQGEEVDAVEAVHLATEAMMRAPWQLADAHIINNVAWLLHQTRDQEDVQVWLPILPGLIDMAYGMYEALNAAANHRASVLYRAGNIFKAAEWLEAADTVSATSEALWAELVSSQGGERYARNLQGVRELRREIADLLAQ